MPDSPSAGNMTGSLLVAHPNLHDPNFRRTILFLSHHQAEEGAVGLVLNRPLGKTVAEFTNPGNAVTPWTRVPVFYGGPVGTDDLVLASLRWQESPSALAFRGFGNLSEDPEVPPEFQPGLRAWRGYAGWSQGQLESEIAEKAWIVLPPTRDLVEMPNPTLAWRDLMRRLGPAFHLLAEMPDHPERN